MHLLLLIFFMLISLAHPGKALELSLPVACQVNSRCFIQNYMDHDTGSGATDHYCGPLSYNSHNGTDFSLLHKQQMHDGVRVLAAADGIVAGIRDGVKDQRYTLNNQASVENRECGNGVRITHENGWMTLYCHMKKGSIQVKKGQHVTRGTPLGEIGLSGRTEFPHLHFAVMKDKTYYNPFTGKKAGDACGTPGTPLWNRKTANTLPYISTNVFHAGFSGTIPTRDTVQQGKHKATTISSTAPLIAFWFEAYGIRKGDNVSIHLLDPTGQALAEHTEPYQKNKARIFRFVGKKNSTGTMVKGIYTGKVAITRNQNGQTETIVSHEQTVSIH